MKRRKVSIITTIAVFVIFTTTSCNKDNNYRDQYLGDFRFKVIEECSNMGSPPTRDTIFYDGVIRKYKRNDSSNDKDRKKKITLEYRPNTINSFLINEEGVLTSPESSTPHNSQYGSFSHIDTVSIYISSSALGGGCSYEVMGIRK